MSGINERNGDIPTVTLANKSNMMWPVVILDLWVNECAANG